MKIRFVFIALLLFSAIACNTKSNQPSDTRSSQEQEIIPEGTIILADSVKIPDALNELYFSVKLVANEYTQRGTYDVQIAYGHNIAETQITFPKGGSEKIIPKIRKGDEPFSYIIGFNYGDEDATFYDYYLAKAEFGKIETKYLKAYSFK